VLGKAEFDAAMLAALAGEKALAADETPVNVLDSAPRAAAREEQEEQGPEEEKAAAGAPHVLIVRTPDGWLTWLQALASRRKADVAAGIPATFTGLLMTDGYTGYQHLLTRLAGIQQCCQHIIRRCRAVAKLGPGGLQSWASEIIAILREAHQAVQDARAPRQRRARRGPAGQAPPALRRGRRVRDHPQPAAGLARGQPPRLCAGLLAARVQRAGLPVHP
jgi:transposase